MICISLSPPYATLIAIGAKRIETRGWSTSLRGPLAIHQTAAPGPKGTTEAALWDRCLSEPFRAALLAAGYGNPARLPRGKIVAVVEPRLVIRVEILESYGDHDLFTLTDQERAFGDYAPGRYAWLLSNVCALAEPLPARGMPGLWRADAQAERAVLAQLEGRVAVC